MLGDLIFARKIAMDVIGRNMDEIDTMLQTGKIVLDEGREHADMISVLLMTFPHLLRPRRTSGGGSGQRPGRDTFAAPEVWANFDICYEYGLCRLEARLRHEPSQRRGRLQVRGNRAARHLRACHASFLKLE